jgi:hypothetical protein
LRAAGILAGRSDLTENSPSTHEGTGKMAETLDFEALWAFKVGRYCTDKREMPSILAIVSFLKDGELIDEPLCASDVLLDFVLGIDYYLPGADRQRLKRFVPRLLDSRDESRERARIDFLADEAVCNWLPLALESRGLGLANEFRTWRGKIEAYRGLLVRAKRELAEFSDITEIVGTTLIAWECRNYCCFGDALSDVVGEMMEDDLAPGIFDTVMNSIDGALSLGKQGSLDAWYVLEAAERFKEVIPKRSD